jgi:hypothetical protein
MDRGCRARMAGLARQRKSKTRDPVPAQANFLDCMGSACSDRSRGCSGNRLVPDRLAQMVEQPLILKRASASRPSGEWNDDDYGVRADGVVVGRIMKAVAAPDGTLGCGGVRAT